MKNLFIKKVAIVVAFALLSILISPLRMLHDLEINLCAFWGFVLSFVLVSVFIRKFADEVKPVAVLWLSLLGISLLTLPTHILFFKPTLGSLPDYVMSVMGVVAGFYYAKFKHPRIKFAYVIVCFIFILIMSTWVDQIWEKHVLEMLNKDQINP